MTKIIIFYTVLLRYCCREEEFAMKWIALVVIWLFGLQAVNSLAEDNYSITALLVFLFLVLITIGIFSSPKNTSN